MSIRKIRAKKQEELDYVLTTAFDSDKDRIVELVFKGPAGETSAEILLCISRENIKIIDQRPF